MVKTSVKFQKNRSKTVGGVAHTRYILYRGTEGRKDRRTDGMTKAKNYVPPLFFEKAGDNKMATKSENADLLTLFQKQSILRND